MVSDFRKKKFLHVFHAFFDTDKSGTIEKNDFDLAIERITKSRGWSAGDPKYKEIQEGLTKVWEGLQSRADADNDGRISEDEWIAIWDNFSKNPASAAEWQTRYCKFAFDLEDASNDGAINAEEFSDVFVSFGFKKEDAVAAFEKMANGKSEVTWAQFQELWKEYFTTEDVNAPGNFIFGKSSF